MSSSMTPVRRYGNPAFGYDSYMLAVHSELPNSTQRNVPKPLGKRGPPDRTVVQSHIGLVKLSPTSYLDVGAVEQNLLRGGNSASGMSSLRSTGGGMNSKAGSGGSRDDGKGNDVGTGDGKCSDDDDGGGSVYLEPSPPPSLLSPWSSPLPVFIDGGLGGSSLIVFHALRRRV
ncbi:hypothetical protein Tco_0144986 [Tanacetum coccineum]